MYLAEELDLPALIRLFTYQGLERFPRLVVQSRLAKRPAKPLGVATTAPKGTNANHHRDKITTDMVVLLARACFTVLPATPCHMTSWNKMKMPELPCPGMLSKIRRVTPSRTVSLFDALPRHSHVDLTRATLAIGKTLDQALALLNQCWDLPSDLPPGLQLHPSTSAALSAPSATTPIESIAVYTDGSYDGDISSWAFVVIGCSADGESLLGWARGRVATWGEPLFAGATQHSALEAERSALFWATAWALQHSGGFVTYVWGDNTAALGQANGGCGGHNASPLAQNCRALTQAVEAAGRLPHHHYGHVRAHKGQKWNELVDVLAKARHLPDTAVPLSVAAITHWTADRSIDWLWMYFASVRQPGLWPQLEGNSFVDSSRVELSLPQPHRRFLNLAPSPHSLPEPRTSTLYLRLVSVNVQTLAEDSAKGDPGRVPFVRHQLDELEANVIGLQETRARRTETITSETHYRFVSSSDTRGNLGVELWISRQHPLMWQGNTPVAAQLDNFRVIGWSPRHLLVRFDGSGVRILFAVCHAPTAADPQRPAWWKTFADQLIQHARNDHVIVLGDLNTRLTKPWPPHVGSLCWESGPELPAHLERLLHSLRLWVPSTHEACHSGLSFTWASPGQGATSRIDFILIPEEWPALPASSTVLHDVDFGQTGVDHFAVRLDLTVNVRGRKGPRFPRQAIDVKKIREPEAAPTVRAICESVPDVPWTTDAHTHCDIITRHLTTNLAKAFPRPAKIKKQPFFSDTTWTLRQQRVSLRKRIHQGIAWTSKADLAWAFKAWQFDFGLAESGVCALATAIQVTKHVTVAIADHKALKPLLRRSIYRDKAEYLHGVAEEASRSSSRCVSDRLRPLLGPPRRKQRGTQALPAILLEDGSTAPDVAAAEARWIRHFSSIEAGGPADAISIAEACFQRQADQAVPDADIAIGDLPSRTQLEGGMCSSQCGRAAGKDNVPTELLHTFAAALSQSIVQLVLKSSMRLTEPLQWKGGDMRQIWKRKGAITECKHYRGILVSSVLGKAVHGSPRKQLGPVLDAIAAPLQIGGRVGFPVQVAIQAAHSTVSQGSSCTEAYVRDSSVIQAAGASQWTSEILREFSTSTWFSYGRLEGTAVVNSGTRPGDNLADVVFSFLFACILDKLRDRFAREDVSLCLPWCDAWLCASPEAAALEPADATSRPLDVTWMDDLCLLVAGSTPDILVEKTTTIATAVITECVQATLLPNLAAGKTEALVCLNGPRSKALRKEIFCGSDPSLQLHSDVWPEARLRLVAKYKHVGGILQ
ncbi:unnamed protein product, partial [Symbiodinium necroappetens]